MKKPFLSPLFPTGVFFLGGIGINDFHTYSLLQFSKLLKPET